MKKLFALFIIIFYILTSNVSAYSIINVSNNSLKYETEFKQKINFTKIKITTLKKLITKIELLVKKTEDDNKKSDEKKEKLLWQLIALSNLINKEIKNREVTSDIVITIIDDKRCTNCMTTDIVSQLKLVPFFAWVKFIEKDFSGTWVSDYLKQNDIKKLPAVIISTNKLNDEWQMQPYLKELKDKQFTLEIGASYDPYAIRSDRWFLVLDKEVLKKIKDNTYLKWNKEAKISWIEYSDLECPFCAKFHNSDVTAKITEVYWDKINKYFNHFPLEFHKNAMPAARILECLWEQKWSDAFYSLMDLAYNKEKSDELYLTQEAIKLSADGDKLDKCISDLKFDEKIKLEQTLWAETFNISWTPASVLINNDTGEFEVISGAYPFNNFQELIDKLLK